MQDSEVFWGLGRQPLLFDSEWNQITLGEVERRKERESTRGRQEGRGTETEEHL
jgi:hypothetical protein